MCEPSYARLHVCPTIDLTECNVGTTILFLFQTVSHIYSSLDRHTDNVIRMAGKNTFLQEQV